MKLLLLALLATLSFASTQYKTPVFVVENLTLYCVKPIKYKNFEMIQYNNGDLVDWSYTSQHCSYNFKSTQDRLDARVAELNAKEEEKNDNLFGPGTLFMLIFFIGAILIILPSICTQWNELHKRRFFWYQQ